MRKTGTLLLLTMLLAQVSSCKPKGSAQAPDSVNSSAEQGGGGPGDTTPSPDTPDSPLPTPVPTPNPTPLPTPLPTPTPHHTVWSEVADELADEVDYIQHSDELSKSRSIASVNEGDSCHPELKGSSRFADAIGFFVEELSKKQTVQIQGIAPYYHMSSDPSTYEKVSLISHELCPVTRSSLAKTIRRVPGQSTINLSNRFADDHNRYRKLYLNGDTEALVDLKKHWGKFFGCLAYVESLSSADSSRSYRVAAKYGPKGYTKPEGVEFYEDPYQNPVSRLNIGIFQFTPHYSGNINPCIKQWNRDYPSCKTSSSSQSQLIPLIGSSLQHFNAYCGVHKLLQTFAVQVNSSSSINTHPNNKVSGSLKKGGDRCVTPHFYAGSAYNHFGPLQNSTGSNLHKLMKCVYTQ